MRLFDPDDPIRPADPNAPMSQMAAAALLADRIALGGPAEIAHALIVLFARMEGLQAELARIKSAIGPADPDLDPESESERN